MKYADGLITLKLCATKYCGQMRAARVVRRTGGRWAEGCSSIMQIHSKSYVPLSRSPFCEWIFWLGPAVIKYWWTAILDKNEKNLAPRDRKEWRSVTENIFCRTCVVPTPQSQGRGDFELCAYTVTLTHSLTHILSISQRETAVHGNQASQQNFNTLDYLLG